LQQIQSKFMWCVPNSRNDIQLGKKRVAMSVWITKRKSKKGMRYLVRWIEPCTGKNRGKTFRRLEDARDYQAKLRQDLRANEYQLPVKISYDEWKTQHLEDLINSPDIDLAPKTIAGHREALAALGKVCKPKSPIVITPKMIREYRCIQLEKGLAPPTINKHIRAIRAALNYAVRAEIISVNKLLGPHRLLLREEKRPLRILTVVEVSKLLNAAKDLRYKAAISLAYYHGIRRREICNLMWQDIDFKDCKLYMMDRPDARIKTRRSRCVALRKETSELLFQLFVQEGNEFVFESPKSFYWTFDKWFPKLVAKAGICSANFHDLRKTCNTFMKENGVPIEVAMQILGHSTMKVNQEYYTGVLTEQQRIAINSLPSIG